MHMQTIYKYTANADLLITHFDISPCWHKSTVQHARKNRI